MTTLVGYMAIFDVPSDVVADGRGRRHRLIVDRHALDGFIAKAITAPLMIHHDPVRVVHSNGTFRPTFGVVTDFRADDFGVLVRGRLDDDYADGIAGNIRSGQWWAMSWGVATIRSDPDEIPSTISPLVIPTVRLLEAAVAEVTITDRPGFPDAKILGVGEQADWIWSMPDLADLALAARG